MPRANHVNPDFAEDTDRSDRGTILGSASRGAGTGRRRDRGRRQRIPAYARGGREVAGDERRGPFRRRNHQDRFGLPKRRSSNRNNPPQAGPTLVPPPRPFPEPPPPLPPPSPPPPH